MGSELEPRVKCNAREGKGQTEGEKKKATGKERKECRIKMKGTTNVKRKIEEKRHAKKNPVKETREFGNKQGNAKGKKKKKKRVNLLDRQNTRERERRERREREKKNTHFNTNTLSSSPHLPPLTLLLSLHSSPRPLLQASILLIQAF